MGLGTQFIELFSKMSATTYVLLIVGLMLVIIEFFQPAHGVSGYCGLALTALGITVRMLGGGTFAMLFMMVFFCAAVAMFSHCLMLWRHKRDWLTTSLALSIAEADSNASRSNPKKNSSDKTDPD